MALAGGLSKRTGTPPYSVRGWPQCGKTVGRNSDLYENRWAFSARSVVRTWSQTEVPPTLVPIKHLVDEPLTVAQLLFALADDMSSGLCGLWWRQQTLESGRL